MKDIQIFLNFANLYWQFIQSFNRIASLLIVMLKTSLTQSTERLLLSTDVISNADVDNSVLDDKMIKKLLLHIKLTIRAKDYLTSDAKAAFI